MFDVAIVGAGIVGSLLGRELTRYGARVCMLERREDVAMGATRANSAIVHAGFDAKEGTLKARFNVRGSKMMEELARELGIKYKRNGSLVVGFSDDDRQILQGLLARGKHNGVEGLRLLEREEVLATEPNIGEDVQCALLAPSGAIVCPYELCIAAVGNAMDNGAELKCAFEVSAIRREGDAFVLTSTRGEEVMSAFVVNCAGVYSDEVARMVGDDSFTVHPRRGEYLLLDKDCGGLVRHTVFRCPSAMGKGVLVTPTVDGNLLLGPTAEDIHDKEDTETTVAGLTSVRRQASGQVDNIDFSKTITSFAGLRSVGSTGDFILSMPVPGFINAAGIESPGLTSAPAIAEYVRGWLGEAGLALQVRADFQPNRPSMRAFSEMSEEEKEKIIRRDPAYAHIVCRCESVSEGEIRAVIHQNPKPHDVDGIKRRTRSTMGRCQGGFCTPYIVRILAEELGEDVLSVTKSGTGSAVNLYPVKEFSAR